MSHSLGGRLPERLFAALRDPASHPSEAHVLLTVDEEGWPHPALLGYAEVLARDPVTLELVTWADSRTTGNLERDGRVTLVVVDPAGVHYVKGRAVAVERAEGRPVATTVVEVRDVLEDFPAAAEGPASITSGITFRRG